MASDPIAIPSLECIRNEFEDSLEMIAIYTQPDRRSGRGKKLAPNAIKSWAEPHNIPVLQPQKMDASEIEKFEDLDSDLVLVMAYGHILPKKMISIPPLGFYNLHASLLPKLRGASPVETSIVIGDKVTGVTLMEVVPALDAGPIVDAEPTEISFEDTGYSLRQKLADTCIPLLQRSLPNIISGNSNSTPQNADEATYCRIIDKTDGYLDFSHTSQQLIDHIRGFQTWPGAIFELEGVTYRIGTAKIEIEATETKSPGTIRSSKKSLSIATADGWLEITEIQKSGGKMLPVAQFLNGNPIQDGLQIPFTEGYPLVQPHYFKKSAS